MKYPIITGKNSRIFWNFAFVVDSIDETMCSDIEGNNFMDSYLFMRKRFVASLNQMMDYDLQINSSPRCLMISSVLLMNSSHIVMSRAIESMSFSKKVAGFNPDNNKIDLNSYEEFVQSMGAMALFVWNFFREGVKDKAESKTLVRIVNELSKNLGMIRDFSSRMVSQNNQKFMVMADDHLKDTTEEMLGLLETRQVVELLESKGAKDIANKIESRKRDILRNIKKAESISKKLESNLGDQFKPLDLSDTENRAEFLRERAATDEKVA